MNFFDVNEEKNTGVVDEAQTQIHSLTKTLT